MKRPIRWRIACDYIGAGKFVAAPDRVIVGTEYGVQCCPRAEGEARDGGWKAQLGSRCVGLLQGVGDTIVAACADGLHVLSRDGAERWGMHALKGIVYEPLTFRDGILLTSRSAIHHVHEWRGSEWRFDFADILGASVVDTRLVNLFQLEGAIIVGVVDYDTGIGRVAVLDGKTGRPTWRSDPGPISELFPTGQASFVWCQTGYGKFETLMTRIDGHELWRRDFSGVGSLRADGSIAMVVGSNESPAWDDWEYRQVSPAGRIERAFKARGRCTLRPLCQGDGSVYFLTGMALVERSASRGEYTRFVSMPQEVLFQHLMGIKPVLPAYEIILYRLRPGQSSLEVLYRRSGTFSLSAIQAIGPEVVFCDGTEILAVEA